METPKRIADRINFYVINLDRSVDRMEQFKKDFEAFPIPFIRVPAIEGKDLVMPIKEYNATKFFFSNGQEATPGEIGCYLSHLKVFKMFLESDKELALICEDDATPTHNAYEILEQAIAYSETWDLLRLHKIYFHSETFFPYRALPQGHNLCTSISGVNSSTAYVVNRRAAEILVKKLIPMTRAYDNALFQGRVGIREATVVPDCMFPNECHNVTTIEGKSKTKRRWKPWHCVFWTSRFRRTWIRIVRYSLQFFRLFKRRFSGSQ